MAAVPEGPEVEATRRLLAPAVEGRVVAGVLVRDPRLRWPVDPLLADRLVGRRFERVGRLGKWLLFEVPGGALLAHLGMTGSLRVAPSSEPPLNHDRALVALDDGNSLVLRDARKFGALLWAEGDPAEHPRLASLGPEVADAALDGAYLYARAAGRRGPVKTLLMDGGVVAGVGNIYACEALWRAGVSPVRAASRVSAARFGAVAEALKDLFAESVALGGTTFRDFVGADGKAGGFVERLAVYGREGQDCPRCGEPVRRRTIAGRATFFCPACQT